MQSLVSQKCLDLQEQLQKWHLSLSLIVVPQKSEARLRLVTSGFFISSIP